MKFHLYAAALVASSSVFAQSVPKNWKAVTQPGNACQYAVPSVWTRDPAHPGVSTSPDNKLSVAAPAANPEKNFEQVKESARSKFPPSKVLEDSAHRYWYLYKEPADSEDSPDTHWYFAALKNGHVCTVQITFRGADGDALPRQIVVTVGPIE